MRPVSVLACGRTFERRPRGRLPKVFPFSLIFFFSKRFRHGTLRSARRHRYGQQLRLGGDEKRRRHARPDGDSLRSARRERPPHARRNVRIRRNGPRPRPQGDHRRCGRRRPSSGHDRRQVHAPRLRRSGSLQVPARRRQPPFDRADAQGRSRPARRALRTPPSTRRRFSPSRTRPSPKSSRSSAAIRTPRPAP